MLILHLMQQLCNILMFWLVKKNEKISYEGFKKMKIFAMKTFLNMYQSTDVWRNSSLIH